MIDALVRDVLLLDGSTLRLRTPTPDDLDEIKAFYDGLSEESRYLRFHGYLHTEVAARAYAGANGVACSIRARGWDTVRRPCA